MGCLQNIEPGTVDPALMPLNGEMRELEQPISCDELDELLRDKHNEGYEVFVAKVLFNNPLTTDLTGIFSGCLERQTSPATYPLCLSRFPTAFPHYTLAFVRLAQMALAKAYGSRTHLERTARAALELVELIIGQTKTVYVVSTHIRSHSMT